MICRSTDPFENSSIDQRELRQLLASKTSCVSGRPGSASPRVSLAFTAVPSHSVRRWAKFVTRFDRQHVQSDARACDIGRDRRTESVYCSRC
jgi:hypothetical protein